MTGRPEDAWLLSVDFGTTATAAAMTLGEKAEVVDIDNAPRMPSMVCWKEPSNGTPGQLLLGDAAENEAVLAPQCAERSPKRKIAQEFILLGSERIRVTDAIGQIFGHVLEEAVPVHGGRRPDELRVTHPARWGEGRLARLRAAAAVAGFHDPLLVPEPVGAAVYFAAGQLLPGDYVAVYDLGGGTFDTAVLQRAEIGFEVIGEPGGRDDLGGEDFDDRLYRYLGRRLDPEQWQTLIAPDSGRSWQRAHYDFKQDVRRAKEHLSRYPDATVRTPIPDGEDIQVSRAEFEALIREDIESTVAELERTVMAAGHSVDDLAAIYVAGGSSRIPLIWRRIEERLGKQPSTFGDPKAVIALGAARVHLPASPGPVGRNETVTTGVGETPQTVAPRPSVKEERPVTRQPESLERTNNLAVAVALIGAVIVIASEFLARHEGQNLWEHHSWIGYPIIVTILALLVSFLVATAVRRSRPALLVLATFVAAFLTATLTPLAIHGYSQFHTGALIGILGGVLATAGGAIAARRQLGMGPTGSDGALAGARAANFAAALGLLVFAGSLLLARRGHGSTWGELSNSYPLDTTVLAAVGLWLVALELTGRRRTLGVTAVLSCFLLGEAVALALPSFKKLQYGFWIGILGALIAVVASAGTILARALEDERAPSRPPESVATRL
jgi:Hsp70 protein